ncbi:MAG: dienelactone hydrolase family protein [Anaerolineales bacterium]|nr:dienelactone hydrolase family protein [Anaerolineales bacterium]
MPHENQPVYSAGKKLDETTAAMILIHGRGANAEDILSLSAHLTHPGLVYLAPQAEAYTWYPNRFIFPVEKNEPHLSSALGVIDKIIKHVEENNIPSEKIFIGGFSQGACLASEYVIRNPKKYGGLFVFSGGYIGALNQNREPQGDLQNTPVFIGCSDIDPHIPLQRVQETTKLLQAMNADVTERIYPNMGHTINEEEIELAREIMQKSLS